ncbi:hypothetical protein F4692_000623 [Nocardioides cavernae]|uniref:Polysaccharide chain length determinant N-terminal domain-containing protein n=1 Tax=Nocardioides cavernae TaxID=1921566 RepID=A0A7Y9KQF6_9ACTN|nr:hypothetical protein [Nocardioides cavernae]NYE35519.1 hypothetical protein [Nocardioides cavernae]
MTSGDLIGASLRWWYVVLVGAVLSLGGVYVATHQPTVYWTQFNVLLIGPKDPEFPNYLEDPRFTLYPVVGVVVSDLNGGKPGMDTASTDTNMVGQGIDDGVQVRVPNLGTQWRRDLSSSHLDVQVAAADPDEVERRADATVDAIAASLEERQDELRIVPGMRVTSIPATKDPTIYQVGGSRMRAAGASGMSGAALTFILVAWLDRRRARRASAHA